LLLTSSSLVSQKVLIKLYCESQFPHKSVNLSFILQAAVRQSTGVSGSEVVDILWGLFQAMLWVGFELCVNFKIANFCLKSAKNGDSAETWFGVKWAGGSEAVDGGLGVGGGRHCC